MTNERGFAEFIVVIGICFAFTLLIFVIWAYSVSGPYMDKHGFSECAITSLNPEEWRCK